MSAISFVARVYDPEWANVWPFGAPLTTRVSDQLAAAGYAVTSAAASKANTIDNLLSFVDLVTLSVTMAPTTGQADLASVTQTVRTVLANVTGYAPASIAFVSAGQAPPAPDTSTADSIADNIAAFFKSITAGANVLTWAIVIGGIVIIYTAAAHPGQVKKWIA